MLSFFRKSSKSSVMAQANNSETTLVSVASTKKQRKAQSEPYQPEFTGMGLGGMPSMGGAHFLPPPPVSPTESSSSKSSFTSGPGKLVPTQPFKSSSPSVVQERLSTAQRGSFETFTSTTTVAPSAQQAQAVSYQRKLNKQHKTFFNKSFSAV